MLTSDGYTEFGDVAGFETDEVVFVRVDPRELDRVGVERVDARDVVGELRAVEADTEEEVVSGDDALDLSLIHI